MDALADTINNNTKHRRSDRYDLLVKVPYDVAQLIFLSMNLTSRLRMPAVSRPWRALSATLTAPTTPEQPWAVHRCSCCPTFRLVDFTIPDEPPAHRLRSPPTVYGDPPKVAPHHNIVAGSHGRFLLLSQVLPHYNCIYNPFSQRTRPLPRESREVLGFLTTDVDMHRAKLSCTPTHGEIKARRCVIAAMSIHKDDQQIFLCYPDSDYWTKIISPTKGGISEFSFHQGRLYAIDRNGIILVSSADLYDSTTATKRASWGRYFDISMIIRSKVVLDRTPLKDHRGQHYYYPKEFLVESRGELLLVQGRRISSLKNDELDFKVYKIVEEKNGSDDERKLVPVNDLGDRMLFVGKGCSVSWSGRSSGFFINNCIYYFPITFSAVIRFNLQGNGASDWFVPNGLRNHIDGHTYMNPVWISP